MSESFKLIALGDNSSRDFDTVLEAMDQGSIFYVTKVKEEFIFTEACDNYFEVALTKPQLLSLIEELKTLAES